MNARAKNVTVVTANGVTGQVDMQAAGDKGRAGLVCVRLETGQAVWVAPEMLVQQDKGQYLLPIAVAKGERGEAGRETTVVPVVEEDINVGKRETPTGGVRVSKVVHERQEMVDTTLVQEELDVERVPVNEFVEAPEPARQDGDTIVVPIYEEALVVEKRLRLKERWIIQKRREQQERSEPVTLRTEEAVVERFEGPGRQQGGKRK